MVLSEGYFNSLIDSAVLLDNRALMALKGSALALDVYAWLAHRLHRIEGRGGCLVQVRFIPGESYAPERFLFYCDAVTCAAAATKRAHTP
jgi:hypothetical protein